MAGGKKPRIEGGEIGYYMDPGRWDDCLRAAIATTAQIPIEQVPDLRLLDRLRAGEDPDEINDESWLRIAVWAERRGLRLTLHETVPADRERWIGVCPGVVVDETGEVAVANPFGDHCLVMSHDKVIFDPAKSVIPPPGKRVRAWTAADVLYGISFDPKRSS